MPTTRCGSTAVLGDETDAASAIGRQLGYWTETLKDLPEQIDLPSDRPRPAVSSYRGESVPLKLSAQLHAGLLGLSRASGASLFMVLQAALAALLTRLGAGNDIPIGSPIAGRTDSALDDLVGFFVNTLVLRTDTSGNPSFRELVARVRTGNLSAYSHQDLPFERLVEVINPARSLSRHPLFQVMLALQNTAEVKLELDGLSCRFERVATSSAKFDLSVSLGEERTADGAPAGIGGVVEYATDLFDRSSVEALIGRLVRLLEAAVANPEQAIGSHRHPRARRARHHPAGVERHRACGPVRDLAAAVRRAGGPVLPTRSRWCTRTSSLTLWRARPARQPAGASSARARRRPRGGGGAMRRALARDARRAHRHPQGRRRLSAARSRLPGRAAGLHAGGRRRAGAGDPIGAARSAARAWRPRRAARCRCACHRGAAHQRAHPGARPAQPRLRHLHLGLHRHAERRGGYSRCDGKSDRRTDGDCAVRAGRCLLSKDVDRLRRLDIRNSRSAVYGHAPGRCVRCCEQGPGQTNFSHRARACDPFDHGALAGDLAGERARDEATPSGALDLDSQRGGVR